MKAIRFAQLVCLVLLLTSCSQRSSDTGSQRSSDTGVDAFGHVGETSGGSADAHFAIRCPFLQQGDRMSIVLLAEYPAKPLQPASVLLLKLTSKNAFSVDGSVGGDSDKHFWHQRFAAKGDKKLSVRYEIAHKPVTEQITFQEKAHSFDEGRVFLVDLTTEPVKITQVNEDLQNLLPGKQLGREDLKGAVEKLREKHESVQDFLRSGK
jgi:hypothetical protein